MIPNSRDELMLTKFSDKFSNEFKFWIHVEIKGFDDCWPWIGRKNGQGYGMYHKFIASRLMFSKSYKKKIGKDLCVCHRCDNPGCVNPFHLFLGTQQENVNDRQLKNRTARGEKISKKLSNEDVFLIRRMANDGFPHDAICTRFGLSKPSVRNILDKRSWSHLNE